MRLSLQMRSLLLSVVFLVAIGCTTGSVPTTRPSVCKDLGAEPIGRSGERLVKRLYSVKYPGGVWCRSSDPDRNTRDWFQFFTSALLKRTYSTGTAPQEEIAHFFWVRGVTVKVDDPIRISTAEGLKSFLADRDQKGHTASQASNAVFQIDTNVISGASCVWTTKSWKHFDSRLPNWMFIESQEGLLCRHSDLEDTVVAILFQVRKREGWREPYPELTRKFRDEAISVIRSLQFVTPR